MEFDTEELILVFICVYTVFEAKTLSKLVKNSRKYLS